LFDVASDLICWGRCGMVAKSQNIHNLPSTPSSPKQSTQPLHHKKQADNEISIHVVDHILAYSSPTLILQQ